MLKRLGSGALADLKSLLHHLNRCLALERLLSPGLLKVLNLSLYKALRTTPGNKEILAIGFCFLLLLLLLLSLDG